MPVADEKNAIGFQLLDGEKDVPEDFKPIVKLSELQVASTDKLRLYVADKKMSVDSFTGGESGW